MKYALKLAALFALLASPAMAQTQSGGLGPYGTPPTPGFGSVDGNWLLGLSYGKNASYQYGVAAAGSGQSTATQLPSNIAFIEIDSGTGGTALPFCLPGTQITVYNNSGATLTTYPNVTNNPVTSAQDTINGSSSKASFSNNTALEFTCAKQGNWSAH
jgi:hypothetical protein